MESDAALYEERLQRFEQMCKQKDVMIHSLQRGLEEQKLRRTEDAVVVEAKASKIKQWVTSRLRELEEQNENLRAQNLKCSRQLQLLKTCAENTACWRNSLLSNSVSGALPVENLAVMTDRGSADSGNTSDAPPDFPVLEWPRVCEQQQTASYEHILCRSTNSIETNSRFYSHIMPLRERNKENLKQLGSHSNPSSPKTLRTPRTKVQMASLMRTHSLPRPKIGQGSTNLSLPRVPKKPVPMPRTRATKGPKATLISNDLLTIERDSLEVNSEEQWGVEIRDSMCNLAEEVCEEDYVNIAEMARYNLVGSDVPPQPPAHRRRPSWEEKLHKLAQQCLGSGPEPPKARESFSTGPPSARYDNRSSSRTTSSDSHQLRVESQGNDIQLPVFTTRHGKVSKGHFGSSSSGGSCVSPQPKIPSLKRSDPSSTDLEPESSPQPYTSGASSISSSSARPAFGLDTRVPVMRREDSSSDEEGDYAVPPDAFDNLGSVGIIQQLNDENGMQISVIAEPIELEKSGYLVSISDSRLKSLKRRWCVLRHGEFLFYKSQKEEVNCADQPLMRIALEEITSVTKLEGKAGAGLEILTSKSKHRFTAESRAVTDEWVRVFNQALKNLSSDQVYNDEAKNATLKGWLTKVKYGHSKKCYAMLLDGRILFFKSAVSKLFTSQLYIKGAHVQDVVRSSDESGSDDGLQVKSAPKTESTEHSLSIQLPQQDPVYLMFNSAEDKDRWFYHLKLASRDGDLYGSPFEVLVQRLMAVDGNPGSELWYDVLLMTASESPKDTMLTFPNSPLKKKALGIAKSCYLFSTVPMLSTAVEYHIDLAQNTLAQTLEDPSLANELLCQLIKLTNGAIRSSVQAWKLLALAVSLVVPNQYPVLWILRKHLHRWTCLGGDECTLAEYCVRALERCQECGNRKERPSKLESISLMTRNPQTHAMPHSIPIHTPDGQYQVIEFDGSSTVSECLSTLCTQCKIRQPLYSGFALYSDDPADPSNTFVLNNKQKLCDVISSWEQKLTESNVGKVPTGKSIRVHLAQRYYWPWLSVGETDAERLYLVYRLGNQLKNGQIPASPELAQQLVALMIQMDCGDMSSNDVMQNIETILEKFYPEKLLQISCRNTLRTSLFDGWNDLRGRTPMQCVSLIIGVLGRWWLLGAEFNWAQMRWRQGDCCWLAVNHAGIHILKPHSMEVIASYPYSTVLSFGGYHSDFMLTVHRADQGADEPKRERLTFTMAKSHIVQVTLLLADYIKQRRQLTHTQSPRRHTPRKSPHRHRQQLCV